MTSVPGVLVSLEATDDAGVAGIEYRPNLSAFQRYADPFLLATGSTSAFERLM